MKKQRSDGDKTELAGCVLTDQMQDVHIEVIFTV